MSKDTYNQALAAVLREEGGKSDNPKDPGGRTNQGITQTVWHDTYRKRMGLPTRDVYIMESSERDAIYRQSYWDLIRATTYRPASTSPSSMAPSIQAPHGPPNGSSRPLAPRLMG